MYFECKYMTGLLQSILSLLQRKCGVGIWHSIYFGGNAAFWYNIIFEEVKNKFTHGDNYTDICTVSTSNVSLISR